MKKTYQDRLREQEASKPAAKASKPAAKASKPTQHDLLYTGESILKRRPKEFLLDMIVMLRGEAIKYGKDLPMLRAEVARLERMLKHRDSIIADKAKLIHEWQKKFETVSTLFGAAPTHNFDIKDWMDHGERHGWFCEKHTNNEAEVIARAKRKAEGLDGFRQATKLDHNYLSDMGFKELVVMEVRRLLHKYPELTHTKEVADWMQQHAGRIMKVVEEARL